MTPPQEGGRLVEQWARRVRVVTTVPAVILGASVNGLSFARSLGRRGIPTLMLDVERLIGGYSRYTKFAPLPPPGDDLAPWVRFLRDLATTCGRPQVLFATSDTGCSLLAEHGPELADQYRFVTPPREAVRCILNKRCQYELARTLGVPIPGTHFPESVDAVRAIADLVAYPCILKPYRAHLRQQRLSLQAKVLLVTSREELLSAFDRLGWQTGELMIQEVVPGPDSNLFGYLAFWDGTAQEHSWVTKRKLRQSALFGDGSFQETIDAPEVARLSRVLLAGLSYTGYVGVEFRLDPRDGAYRLMEINGRTVSGNQLAVTSGVDFPWIGYQSLVSPAAAPRPGRGASGVRYVHEEWDLKAFLRLRKDGELTVMGWLRSVAGAAARALWAADDPAPFLVTLGRLVLTSLRHARRRVGI